MEEEAEELKHQYNTTSNSGLREYLKSLFIFGENAINHTITVKEINAIMKDYLLENKITKGIMLMEMKDLGCEIKGKTRKKITKRCYFHIKLQPQPKCDIIDY